MWKKVVTNWREYYKLCASDKSGNWKCVAWKTKRRELNKTG